MHQRASKRPDLEIETCRAKLQLLKTDISQLQEFSGDNLDKIVNEIHSRLSHVSDRLVRATRSMAYEDAAKKALLSCKQRIGSLEPNFKNPENLNQSMEAAESVEIPEDVIQSSSSIIAPVPVSTTVLNSHESELKINNRADKDKTRLSSSFMNPPLKSGGFVEPIEEQELGSSTLMLKLIKQVQTLTHEVKILQQQNNIEQNRMFRLFLQHLHKRGTLEYNSKIRKICQRGAHQIIFLHKRILSLYWFNQIKDYLGIHQDGTCHTTDLLAVLLLKDLYLK